MNAHQAFPTITERSLRRDAQRIVSGQWRNPYGLHSFYTAAEWAYEAQCFLDNGCDADACDFAFMIEREEEAERRQSMLHGGEYADWLYECRREEQMLAAWERGH